DDHGDLTAFDALDDLADSGVKVMRVAVRSDESPEELLERADLVVDSPSDVVHLLRRLLPVAD
ncbi:MAG: trehalose-phosphatase, partial [Candidatus Nephthysia bennettiae]